MYSFNLPQSFAERSKPCSLVQSGISVATSFSPRAVFSRSEKPLLPESGICGIFPKMFHVAFSVISEESVKKRTRPPAVQAFRCDTPSFTRVAISCGMRRNFPICPS